MYLLKERYDRVQNRASYDDFGLVCIDGDHGLVIDSTTGKLYANFETLQEKLVSGKNIKQIDDGTDGGSSNSNLIDLVID